MVLTLGAIILADGCSGTGIGLVQWEIPQAPSSEEVIPERSAPPSRLSASLPKSVNRVDPFRSPAWTPPKKLSALEYSYLRYDDHWTLGNRVEQFLMAQDSLTSGWKELRSGLWSPPSMMFGP